MSVPASSYGGLAIRVYRDNDGNLPGAVPRINIVRTPTLLGGENLQMLGHLRAEWALDLELDSGAYTVFSGTMIGTSEELVINDVSYGWWFLEEILSVRRRVTGDVRCTVRFLEDS